MHRYRAFALTATAALIAALWPFARACAQTPAPITIPVSGSPVIRLQMRTGRITIRTWKRNEVQIASSVPVDARQFDPAAVAQALRGGDIPIFAASVITSNGPLILPPEEFFVPSVLAQPHEGVALYGADGNVTVTVPETTALIWALVGRGRISLQDYRNGAFVTRVHTGAVSLFNVGGDAYVEVARGRIDASNCAFNRIRARTATGNLFFENCNTRQIEASSIEGSIAYDNGTFVPGLARFESGDGDIALGLAGGGAMIAAHSAAGRIFTGLASGARIEQAGSGARAYVGGGGPVVTATTLNGNIYLYSGSYKKQPQLQRKWQALRRVIRARTSAKRPHRV